MNKVVALQPERPHDLTKAQLDLVKRTVAKDCNRDEFDMFMAVCRRVGLDPFRRQIHSVIYNKDKPEKRQMVLITGIDGFRAVAARAGNYRPDENPAEYEYDESLKDPARNPRGIVRAVVRPWKQGSDGLWHQLAGEAYWEEFAPLVEGGKWENTGETWANGKPKKTFVGNGTYTLDKKNDFWRRMPNLMLAKCAEAQALRKGWPEDLSGIYASEEMHRTDAQNASDELEDFEKQKRLEQLGVGQHVTIQWNVGEELKAVPTGQFVDKAIEFVKKSDSPTEIDAWRNRNKHSLQQFWAKHPADALELKKIIEGRITALESEG